MKRFILSTFLLITLHFFNPNLWANGIGIVDGVYGVYLTMVESNISVEVNNQIAITTTTQVFKNRTGSSTPFKYAFPLNKGANPVGLRWFIGGEWSEADVSSNTQDNNIPGSGNGSGNDIDPNLLSYLGSQPLFFPLNDILGNDSIIIIELKYVELLPYFLGKVSYHYKNNISLIQYETVYEQGFNFVLNSEREILDIGLEGLSSEDAITANSANLSYETFETIADFDYDIEYELSSEGLGIFPLSTFIPDTLFNCDTLGNGYVSVIIEPESNVDTEVIEKNFTLIIDRSGSMSGDKIVQARDAASFIINNLNLGDKFNVIDFSTQVTSVFESHRDFTIENQNLALSYIDGITSGGSTNISEALTISINQFQAVDPDKANIILFFTDGEATAGTTDTPGILEIVTNQVNTTETSIFLFTFGIGQHVDNALLTLLAQQNNGLVQFVENENLEEEITQFFLSINNPVLINTSITFEPNNIFEVYPNPYPNLYKGQQLIISGRYTEAQTVDMHIEGQAFNIPVVYDFELSLADTTDLTKSILPKIWAKQKIDALSLDFYLAPSTDEANEIQAEIDSTSICFGVVSVEFTSFEDNTTEIDEVNSALSKYQIKISPNPFNELIKIQIERKDPYYEAINIELYDIHGRLITKKVAKLNGYKSVFQLDELNHLAPGIYFCKIKIGTELFTLKVIKT